MKTYNEILEEVLRRVRSRLGDVYVTDLTIVLAEIFAYIFDNLVYYVDMQYRESFLDSAQFEDSVVRIAKQLGYRRRGAKPLKVRLKDEVVSSAGQPYEVGEIWVRNVSKDGINYFEFNGDGWYVGSLESVDAEFQGNVFKTVTVYAGGVADGFVYMIDQSGNFWRELKGNLDFQITPDKRRYFLVDYYRDRIVLNFGAGNLIASPAGRSCTVYYFVAQDVDLSKVAKHINEVISLYDGVESVDSIKANIVERFANVDRIVTIDDLFAYMKRNYPSYLVDVGKKIDLDRTSFGQQVKLFEHDLVNYIINLGLNERQRDEFMRLVLGRWNSFIESLAYVFNFYDYSPSLVLYVLKRTGEGLGVLSYSEVLSLERDLDKRMPVGVKIFVLSDANRIVNVDLNCHLQEKYGYGFDFVKREVEKAIKTYFDGLGYGSKFVFGDLISYVYREVDGVDDFTIISFNYGNRGDVVRRLESGGVVIGYELERGYVFSLKNLVVTR